MFWSRRAPQRFVRGPRSAELLQLEQQVIQLRAESRWLEAVPLAERLVALAVREQGEDSVATTDALHHWAWLVQSHGDYDKAEQLWRRALAIDERMFGKDTVQTTRRMHLLANLYRDRGDFQAAEPLLRRALAIREKSYGPNHGETAQILNSLGQLLSRTGDLAGAEASLRRALRIYEASGDDGQRNIAATLSSLSWVYILLGDMEEAERVARGSLELRKKRQGPEHTAVAGSMRELAMIRRARGDLEEAADLFREGLRILEQRLGTNHLSLASLLNDLASTRLSQGHLTDAEAHLQRCRGILEQSVGADHPRVASVWMDLGRLEEMKGNYQAAREFCEQARHIRHTHWGASHPLTISSLRRVAHLDALLGKAEHALAVADSLQDAEEQMLANVFSFTSERQRLAYHARAFQERCDPWASLGAAKPLARAILRTKGLVLDSLIEDRILAEASDNPIVGKIVAEGEQARRALDQWQAQPGAASAERQLERESLVRKIESLQASLARHVAGSGRLRRAHSVDAEQVQAALPHGTVLLEFVRYRDYRGRGEWREQYGALMLSRDDEPRWVVVGDADGIDRAVKLYQHAVRNADGSQALVQALRSLYDLLWAPINRRLPPGIQGVIVSPDDALNFVSFATLLTPADHFLGEAFLFSYVSCGRDLLAAQELEPIERKLFIWANPDFGASPSEADRVRAVAVRPADRSSSFPPLPGAEKEGRALYERARTFGFSNAVLFVGAAASEAELHQIRSPAALHFATHAFVWPEAKAALWTDQTLPGAEPDALPRPIINAMFRSALALAGGHRTLQFRGKRTSVPANNDGIVTAHEIAGLDLRRTRLVVLSACDTGAGDALGGENILGLRRGFIQAGAQNLVLTLWPVVDERAVSLMLDFYQEFSKGSVLPTALARVQRTWLRRLRVESGPAEACRVAGPYILSFQGGPEQVSTAE